MLRAIIERDACKLPLVRIIRWRPVSHKNRWGDIDIFSIVEQCALSKTGYRYWGTKTDVEGKHTDVANSLLSLWGRLYRPYDKNDLGDGIHFTAQSLDFTREMLLNSIESNVTYLCKKNVLYINNDQIHLVSWFFLSE